MLLAPPTEAGTPAGGNCTAEAARQEQAGGIPRGLLVAIARTESGRWDPATEQARPWPWTVTAGGAGRYFASKAEAVAEVEILLSQGVTNVDVGCMQINMHHHWDAFETLEEAFEPAANVAYAATYLRKMRDETPSWEAAAGRYHSATPARARYYRGKVLDHWREIRAAEAPPQPAAAATVEHAADAESAPPTQAAIDTARIAALNAAFRSRRDASRATAAESPSETLRAEHLAQWRAARSRQAGLQHLLAVRQAELERKRQELLRDAERVDREASFAERRRRQLDAWRQKTYQAGDS